jgi:DNA-binding NarL/FixJ family response regulator
MITSSIEVSPLTIEILTSQYIVWHGLRKVLESSVTLPMVVYPHRRRTQSKSPAEIGANVYILDLETERNALGTIKQIRESTPTSKIVLLCGFEDHDRTREAFNCGVDGIILMVQPPAVMLAAIETLYIPTNRQSQREQVDAVEMGFLNSTVEIEPQPLEWPQTLTKREKEIVQLVGQGLSNKDIAYTLSISNSTVRHHMTSIFDKVGVPSRQKLMVHTHRLTSTPHPSSHAHHPG